MEWLLAGPQMHNAGSQIGVQVGNSYSTQDIEMLGEETLSELLGKLSTEDRTLRTFRRALGFSQIIQKDLVPLLIHEKEDLKILDAVVRLLVNLTIPVECLLPMEIMARTDAGRHTIFELNNLLAAAKESFIEPRSTRSILQFMQRLLDSEDRLSPERCEGINNCLLLVRNILHIPEPWSLLNTAPTTASNSGATASGSASCSKQNLILWNLFAQGFDKVLIHLMTCPQKGFWSITMVQLIALTYKDQHVGTLQKLLNLWFETSLSESSEDNESNTSPPDQGSGDSSPMMTSDPTSDSSDNSSGSTNQASDNGGAAKHLPQRGHSDHIKNNNKMMDMSRKPPTAGPSNAGGGRAKGSGGKGHQHKKQQQCEQQESTSNADQEQDKPNRNEMAGSGGVSSRLLQVGTTISSSPPASPATATLVPSSPAPSTSGVSFTSGSSSTATTGNCTNNCGNAGGNGKRVCSSSELSDCGYGTQVENQESMSTSSNEDELSQDGISARGMKPVHQKPHCSNKHNRPQKLTMSSQEKREWRRKKLVKRSRTNILNIKALMQHTPTDEDISHLLKEFTVDFLLKGYGPLVHELHAQMISELGTPVDTSHFFWLVTYFLKFAAQLDLELESIVSPVLSYKVVSYLTFEGVSLCEQLQLALMHQETDLKPCLRRLHLVVTAIREFIQAVDIYKKSSHLSNEDNEFLTELQIQMSNTRDLRNLFVLLLRHYTPGLQSKQYLQDLITTNHTLLLFFESSSPSVFDITEHVKQFASAEMMQQYGRLLESFRDNGLFINNCVFTMMHHISGDLNLGSALFQPGILKTFSLIWEEDFEVCDDWSDLIEYVIHKFVSTPRRGHPMLPLCKGAVEASLVADIVPEIVKPPPKIEQNTCRWTKEECDTLYWYFIQSSQSSDSVGHIQKLYSENGSKSKTRVGIIEQLYMQDIIPHAQYLDLLKQETVVLQSSPSDMDAGHSSGLTTPTVIAVPNTSQAGGSVEKPLGPPPDDITSLIALLLAEHHGAQITWLQEILLELCFIKLNQCNMTATQHIMEPVPYHYVMMRQSIPLVPWNLEQFTVLMHPPFVLLLHKLGFHLPADVGKVFPRIPHFWTAEVLYATAQKLGPIKTECLKFDVQLLQEDSQAEMNSHASEEEMSLDKPPPSPQRTFCVTQNLATLSTVRFTPMLHGTPNWLQLISKSKQSHR